MDHLKELYHLRWSQKTAYRDLKYPLCLKAFHSQKYAYIVQEVFATYKTVQEYEPDTDAVIELGGEDAKIIF